MNKNHECFISRRGINSPWILALEIGEHWDKTITEVAKIAKSSLGQSGKAEIRDNLLVFHGERGCCFFKIPIDCVDTTHEFIRDFPRIRGHAHKSRLDVVGGKYVLVIKKN